MANSLGILLRILSSVAMVLSLQLRFALPAIADDVPAQIVRATANLDGRMEVFAVASNGSLYHRWENLGTTDWSPWTLNANMEATRIEALSGDGGALFAFALSGHSIVVRRQAHAGSGFEVESTILGSGLNSLAAAVQANDRMAVFAVDQSGMLQAARQISDNRWEALVSMGGHDLLGGITPSGRVAPFIVTPNALAAAAAPNGLTDVFAIGGDHKLYVLPYADTPQPEVWSGLEGNDLAEISAVSASGAPTVVAIDDAGMLQARTLVGNVWLPWQQILPTAVDDWHAVPDTFGGVDVFARSGQQFQVAHRDASGNWSRVFGDVPLSGPPGQALTSFSLASSSQHKLLIAGIDSIGNIFTLPLTALNDAAGFQNDQQWTWRGGVTVSPNVPEFVGKFAFCGGVSPDTISQLQSDIAADVSAAGLADLAAHPPSVTLTCNADQSETLAIWLNRQPSPSAIPELSLAPEGTNALGTVSFRVTEAGLQRIVDTSFADQPNPMRVGSRTTINVKGHSLKIDSKGMSLHISAVYHGQDIIHPDLEISANTSVKIVNGSTSCSSKVSVDSHELKGIVGWLGSFMPLFVPFTTNKLVNDNYNSQKSELADATALNCQLTSVFPSDILLSQAAGSTAPLQKLQFCYDNVQFRNGEGLTVYGNVAQENRVPRVQWFPLPGPGRGAEAAIHPSFDFIATTADMRAPALSWSASPGLTLTNVTPDGRVVNVSLDKFFLTEYQTGATWGTITVKASDADGQTATFSNPLTIEPAMLLGTQLTPDEALGASPPALPSSC